MNLIFEFQVARMAFSQIEIQNYIQHHYRKLKFKITHEMHNYYIHKRLLSKHKNKNIDQQEEVSTTAQ